MSNRARRNFRDEGREEWRWWRRSTRGTERERERKREREKEIVGLWGTRGHLSVNGFCNWESVKLPNRPVHLLALLDELNQPLPLPSPPVRCNATPLVPPIQTARQLSAERGWRRARA
ncbi:hypothetical protein PUN28_007367 [Cardiocondyla obscurior]|uniref:Uncharacterized protein n=1 Tax=Cardiocondyla obscurior TaxID=286306 RepID=A0AAW2G808_9HYME